MFQTLWHVWLYRPLRYCCSISWAVSVCSLALPLGWVSNARVMSSPAFSFKGGGRTGRLAAVAGIDLSDWSRRGQWWARPRCAGSATVRRIETRG